ncbi:MAG TPA: SDR family oxidoreductase [Myxococcaceae bacterium]|nr:SDR family oxidoreductase [Myxococcaceae bacterium]
MANTHVDMKGRVVLVTGANAGLGKETALALAKMGARVICVSRDRARGEAAVAEIKAQSGSADVELMLADLSSQKSIRAFAAEFKRTHDRLHVLVNNAGVINPERKVTEDGYEATFALNHLGYFLLTHELLDVLKASTPARIINLASEAQRGGHIDFDDLHFERRKYSSWGAYMQSKLANVMFTYDLAKRLEGTGVTVNAVHPGGVATNFGQEFKGFTGFFLSKLFRPFARTPAKGAETSVYLASSPEVEGVTGGYFADNKPIRSSRESNDENVRRRLWEVSEKLTGVTW